MSEAIETRSGSSDASLCSGAARKAPADEADVQGTAALAEVEAAIDEAYREVEKDFSRGSVHDRSVAIAQGLGMMLAREAVRKLYCEKANTVPRMERGSAAVP